MIKFNSIERGIEFCEILLKDHFEHSQKHHDPNQPIPSKINCLFGINLGNLHIPSFYTLKR